MRIDVSLAHRDLDEELARLYRRMGTAGDALHGLRTLPCALPGVRLHGREQAGETYVYVEDVAGHALAGCTVFNRPSEPGTRRHGFLRSPHSRYASGYRRRGLATAVYQWALQSGWCLLSGPRQSEAAHQLWRSLGRTYPLLVAELEDRRLRPLEAVEPVAFQKLDTRLLLLGATWSASRFADEAGFTLHGDARGEATRHGLQEAAP